MSNLSDKIIDDQGNARTYSNGYDSRLHYVDVNGQDKKYLIDGEGGGGIPNPITLGDASIFTDNEGKFHIKFNCGSMDGDGYLDLCFYVYESYDATKEARCELSFNKMVYPEEEDPYLDTKYIFRGGYNEIGDTTYFTTSDFEEYVEDNEIGNEDGEICPECGGATLDENGECPNCHYHN